MASQRKQLIRDVKEAGVYKKPVLAQERILKGYKKGIKPSKETYRAKRTGAIARKAANIVAPKGSMVKALTKSPDKKSGRGRGRPSGTYKVRYLPISRRAVKVPTSVYKKMASAEKAQYRLAKAQQLAQIQMQAEQISMQQDPRYQMSSEDQFLEEQDPQHEMNVALAQQQAELEQQYSQYPSQRQGTGRKILQRFRRERPSAYVDEYGQVIGPYSARYAQPLHRPNVQMDGLIREPQVNALGGKASLLQTPQDIQREQIEDSMLTEHRDINFFTVKQPVVVPDRSKLLFFKDKRGSN